MDAPELPGLHERFRDWVIERHPAGPAWTATRRQGTATRVVAGYDLIELRAKLEQVNKEDASTE